VHAHKLPGELPNHRKIFLACISRSNHGHVLARVRVTRLIRRTRYTD